jgi:hypothetical protein
MGCGDGKAVLCLQKILLCGQPLIVQRSIELAMAPESCE